MIVTARKLTYVRFVYQVFSNFKLFQSHKTDNLCNSLNIIFVRRTFRSLLKFHHVYKLLNLNCAGNIPKETTHLEIFI